MEQPAGSVITIRLDQLQADLDLIIIQPCTNTPLVSSTKSGTLDEVISITAVSTTRVLHVVIDGYAGAISPYRMSLTCPLGIVDNVANVGLKSIDQISKKESILTKMCEPYLEEG